MIPTLLFGGGAAYSAYKSYTEFEQRSKLVRSKENFTRNVINVGTQDHMSHFDGQKVLAKFIVPRIPTAPSILLISQEITQVRTENVVVPTITGFGLKMDDNMSVVPTMETQLRVKEREVERIVQSFRKGLLTDGSFGLSHLVAGTHMHIFCDSFRYYKHESLRGNRDFMRDVVNKYCNANVPFPHGYSNSVFTLKVVNCEDMQLFCGGTVNKTGKGYNIVYNSISTSADDIADYEFDSNIVDKTANGFFFGAVSLACMMVVACISDK